MNKPDVLKLREFSGHNDSIYCLVKTGVNTFLSASGEGWIAGWHLDDDKGKLLARLPGSIFAIEFLKEKNLLLAGHNKSQLHVLDLNNNQQLKEMIFAKGIFSLKYIPLQNMILVGIEGGEVMVLSYPGLEPVKNIQPVNENARCIELINNDKVAIGFSDNFIRVFQLPGLKLLHEFEAHDNSVFSLAWLENQQLLLSGGRDAQLRTWKMHGEEWVQMQQIPAHLMTINDIAVHPGCKYFVTASRDKTFKIWNAEDFKLLKVIDKARGGHFHSVNKAIWMDESTLLTAGDDKRIIAWNILFNE